MILEPFSRLTNTYKPHKWDFLQARYGFCLENDRFKIYDRCPMTDVAMAISTDADTDADVADLDHLVTS